MKKVGWLLSVVAFFAVTALVSTQAVAAVVAMLWAAASYRIFGGSPANESASEQANWLLEESENAMSPMDMDASVAARGFAELDERN